MQQEPTHTPKTKSRKPLIKRLKRLLLWLFSLFILLNILIFFVLKNESIQNYLVNKVTQNISKKIGHDIKIDHVNLTSFFKPYIEGVYIEDNRGDTLLSCNKIYMGIGSSPLDLVKGNILIDNIDIINPYIRIVRDRNRVMNFDYSIVKDSTSNDQINKNQTSDSEPNLVLNIKNININNLKVFYSDTVNQVAYQGVLENGEIISDYMDLACNEILLNSVELTDFDLVYSKFVDMNDFEVKAFEPSKKPFNNLNPKPDLQVATKSLIINNSSFHLHKKRKVPLPIIEGAIDFDNMLLNEINLKAHDISYLNKDVKAYDLTINLKESTGFNVKKMYAVESVIGATQMDFKDLEIISDYSHIYGQYNMSYDGFKDFEDYNNNIYMKGLITTSELAVRDLFYFSKPLHDNSFFIKNKGLNTTLSGQFRGKVNSLRAQDLKLNLGNKLHLEANFRSRDITNKDELSLDMEVKKLNTNFHTLNEIIPNFNTPNNFNKIGQVNFRGRFSGFLNDFVSSGDLYSDIGKANLDIRFHSKDNKFDNYEGYLKVFDFDLKKWSDNDQFGLLNFDVQVLNGTGFTLENVNAVIKGKINSLAFRNYNYKDATINGTINKNLFEGDFNIKDKNVNFDFAGNINNKDEIPTFKFNSTIYNIDLKKLNLYDKELRILGTLNMDLKNIDLDKALGEINLTGLIMHSIDTTIFVDSMRFSSELNNDKRVMKLTSDVANLKVAGTFTPTAVLNEIKTYFKVNQPYLYDRLYNKNVDSLHKVSNYHYDFAIGNINPIIKVLGIDNFEISPGIIKGDFNSLKEEYKVNVQFPFLKVDSTSIFNILTVSTGIKNKLNLDVELDSFYVNGKMIPKTVLVGQFKGDSTRFDIMSKDLKNDKDYIDLSLNSVPRGNDQFDIHIEDSLFVLGDLWTVNDKNHIFFSKDSIDIEYLSLKNDSLITLDINTLNKGRGLNVNVSNLDMHLIDRFWDYKKLNFNGYGDLNLSILDVFKRKQLGLDLNVPHIKINEDDWGNLTIACFAKDLYSPVNNLLSIQKDTQLINLEGKYYSPFVENKPIDLNFKHAVSQELKLKNLPLNILEYFIPNGITNTKGVLNGSIKFNGDIAYMNIDGKAALTKGETTVDYLNTRYYFDNDTVSIDNYTVDATGAKMQDELGHWATIEGGLVHDHLKDFELDVKASSPEFLVLNTNKTLNPLYYGKVIGDITAGFYGPFNRTDIKISGTTGRNTVLNIPINYDSDGSDLDYIEFIKSNLIPKETIDFSENGISVVLDIKVNEEAKGRIIFDEDAGDVIEGYGVGDIKLDILRDEPFFMQGKYTFSRGEYLFTLKDVIKKPFIVKEGSSIVWSGDPLAGIMDIEALYVSESAKVYNLIVENLSTPELKKQASLKTPVYLKLFLKDELLKPSIDFDIEIPEVANGIKNLVTTKLSSLRSNKAELNRQVLGLIVANSFLPSDLSSNGTAVVDYSLTTDFVTNELSNLVSDLLVKAIEDIDFISNIDFNLGYTTANRLGNDYLNPYSTFDLNLPVYLYDDRISITVGASIGINSSSDQINQANYFNGDIQIEYAITNDRRIKVVVLTKRFNDYLLSGNNIKYGAGFRYYREFDSLRDLFKKNN